MIIPGIDKKNHMLAWQLAKAARGPMVQNDRDAFGYAAIGKNGVFGEKWTDVKMPFKKHKPGDAKAASKFVEIFGDRIPAIAKPSQLDETTYARFGKPSKRAYSIMLHARAATCGGNVENAHPFYSENTALIHNGIIANARELVNKISTCDSETILNAYLELGIQGNVQAMQDLSDKLAGYYAVAVMGHLKEGTPYVDIFKDRRAFLYATYIPALDRVVFCTTPGIVKSAAKACKLLIGKSIPVPDDVFIRLDARTGKPIATVDFTSGKLDTHTIGKGLLARAGLAAYDTTEYSSEYANEIAEEIGNSSLTASYEQIADEDLDRLSIDTDSRSLHRLTDGQYAEYEQMVANRALRIRE